MVSIDAICRYQIPNMIPPGGQISLEEISQKTGLNTTAVKRIIQHAMTMRILREPEPRMIAHTSISKFMTLSSINGWVEFEGRDTWPANARVSDRESCTLEKRKSMR